MFLLLTRDGLRVCSLSFAMRMVIHAHLEIRLETQLDKTGKWVLKTLGFASITNESNSTFIHCLGYM